MATIASDHIKPCNLAQSEAHNRRTTEYMAHIKRSNVYIREDLTRHNEEWIAPAMREHRDLTAYYEHLKRLVKEKTGRKMQEKVREVKDPKTGRTKQINGSSPLRESCLNIKDDTQLADVFDYVAACHSAFGIQAIQIFIHRDEGHWDGPDDRREWKPNTHAHIIWDWIDHSTGKSFKLTKVDMSRMQDMAAECLEMERGRLKELTGVEHLERNDYIIQKQKTQLAQQALESATLESDIAEKSQRSQRLDADIENKDRQSRQLTQSVKEQTRISDNLRDTIAERNVEIIELERKRSQKEEECNKENGNQIIAGMANLLGKGEMARLKKENESLTKEKEALRQHDVEVTKREQAIPQIIQKEVTKQVATAMEKANAEHQREKARLMKEQDLLVDKNKSLQLTIDYTTRCIKDLWSVLSDLLRNALRAIADFIKSESMWLSRAQDDAITAFVNSDRDRRQKATELKAYCRLFFSVGHINKIDREIDEILDRETHDQTRSRSRGR